MFPRTVTKISRGFPSRHHSVVGVTGAQTVQVLGYAGTAVEMVYCAYCGKAFTRKEHLERHIPSREKQSTSAWLALPKFY